MATFSSSLKACSQDYVFMDWERSSRLLRHTTLTRATAQNRIRRKCSYDTILIARADVEKASAKASYAKAAPRASPTRVRA